MNFIDELKWRGMLHDAMPGTEDLLSKEKVTGYIGFDPTADSLGVGNMVQIMTLLHFQRAGHKPIALVGGATGMVGDPSGKSLERNLIDEETLNRNLNCQRKQLEKFLDFNCGENSAEIVNNYDWFKGLGFLEFIRDVGKHITVNYMLAKDSVKNRLENGMSFMEFSYQLIQGYDFFYLWQNRGVKLQMGGSDQWGNIVTGTELIRRKANGEAFALTTPLIKKADGTKFGKSESGNVWLDRNKTSPYSFYQFWLNASDEDVKTYIRIFSLKDQATIEALEAEHIQSPHLRLMQKELAKEITIRVHSEADYQKAVEITEVFFNGGADDLQKLSAGDLGDVFNGLGKNAFTVSLSKLKDGIGILDLLAAETSVFASKGEARKMISANGTSLNKEKFSDPAQIINTANLLAEKYILFQKGKKNFFLLKAE
ncbi:MAG: tyrosine--tRNA ligase [Bacteroidetes bacterium]|nr:MAG: tyrosyl-tRNA synthetase [Bacteroidetes bacterium OLB10]MBV6453573.1 Tyrosine--tRNA ligase [Bacteroidia bacterium]MBX3106146.1 tyrosine--tRNA ligase [Bacteroidota bacterium]MCE7954769.1 tyrosine--tRNA ligase [Bacteroidetes bacterium CHB6]MCB0848636.1 tyrosine--tRNA ligase [Bacteroidota bacterium]